MEEIGSSSLGKQQKQVIADTYAIRVTDQVCNITFFKENIKIESTFFSIFFFTKEIYPKNLWFNDRKKQSL